MAHRAGSGERDHEVPVSPPPGELERLDFESSVSSRRSNWYRVTNRLLYARSAASDEIVLECDVERLAEQRASLMRPLRERAERLGVQGLGRAPREAPVPRRSPSANSTRSIASLVVAGEVVDARRLGGQHGDVGVRLVGGEDGERRLEQRDRLVDPAELPECAAHAGRGAGGVVGVGPRPRRAAAPRRGARARSRARRRRPRASPRVRAAPPGRAGSWASALAWSKARRASCVAASAAARSPARFSQSRAHASIWLCVVRALVGAERIEVVGGDHLGDLVRIDARTRRRGTRPPGGASPCGRGVRASRRRPAGRAPGGSRTGRARASAGRTRARAPPCGRGRRAAAAISLRCSRERGEARGRRRSCRAPRRRRAAGAPPGRGRRAARRSGPGASRGRRGRRSCPTGRYSSPCALEQAAVEQHAHGLDRVQRDRRRRGRGSARAASSGRPGTSPASIASIASPESGSRKSDVKLRVLAPQPPCRSASSGRASVITKIGRFRDHSSRYSTNSTSAESAHWMSSKSRTTGPCSAIRSKNIRQPEKRSSRSGAVAVGRGRAAAGAAARRTRAPPGRRRTARRPRSSLASAVSAGSSSVIRARIRTISASAQKAIASP